jgi:hypothetical protein
MFFHSLSVVSERKVTLFASERSRSENNQTLNEGEKIMITIRRFIAMWLCLLLCLPVAQAQQAQKNRSRSSSAQEAGTSSAQDVTIIIQQENVRFTAQKAVQEMRLQVYDQTGELVFDSGKIAEPELNWLLRNGNGDAIKSGLYAYTLSIREAGAESAKERRGHFIVDRAKERDKDQDRLWITSRSDSEVGAELTVARSEDTTIAGARTASKRKVTGENGAEEAILAEEIPDGQVVKNLNGLTDQVTLEAGANVTITPNGNALMIAAELPAGQLSGAGAAGRLARFNSETELASSEISEVNGNLGVGTDAPTSKLDVRGHFTLDAGGSPVLYTAADGGELGRYLQLINSPAYASASGLKAGGVLVSDSYAFANPGKNDLIVKGSVAFGTPSLSASRVTIEGQDALTARGYEPFINLQDSNDFFFQSSHRIQSAHGDLNFFHGYRQPPANPFEFPKYVYVPRMTIKDSGNVGIGNIYPNHQLSIGRGPTWTRNGWGGSVELENASAIAWKANAAGQRFGMGHTNSGFYFFRTTSDPGTTGAPAVYDMSISDTGVVSVRVLQITGGADFAENFDVNAPASAGAAETAKVEPGMVVSIDPASPGRLALTTQAYDRRVAGIISGAGGVKPGMTMSQEGTLAHGQLPVALSGRVYCQVDASFGAIEPGDLLTTSSTPGHAMKVTDAAKAQGAIIGKAMTSLKEGKGLVLVLVTLQ